MTASKGNAKSSEGSAEKRTAAEAATDGEARVDEPKSKKQKGSGSTDRQDDKDSKPHSSSERTPLLRWLLTDDAFALAYPPIDPGKGEVDLPPGKQSKPAPKRPQSEKDGNEPKTDADDQKKKDAKTETETDDNDDDDDDDDDDADGGATKRESDDDAHAGEANRAGGGGASQPDSQPAYPASLDLTPFQTLICSALLSKPISHRLGLRAIATLFSAPYSYTTPKKLEAVGSEGRRAALWDSRTQHKEKTAEQLGSVVEGARGLCESKEHDVEALGGVLRAAQKAADEAGKGKDGELAGRKAAADAVTSTLSQGIKGIGPGACDIFLRRIQHHWPVVYPFIDARTLEYAVELGLVQEGNDDQLPARAQELATALEEATKADKKSKDHQRRDYTRLLDVLVGLGLEKQLEQAKTSSASQSDK
ncbi:unnamed protein product [Parajaminaea phylloscopi]